MGGVTIKDGGVTSTNLSRVVENDYLGVERSGLFSRVVLGVRGDVSTTDIFNGDVPIKR